MSKYVTVQMYFQKWERYNADGYFPDPTNSTGLDGSTYETFHLNDDGEWTQEYIYDEPENLADLKASLGDGYISRYYQMNFFSIKGLDGDNGIRLLNILNEETKTQQLEIGVLEADIQQGHAIRNIMGSYIYGYKSSDEPQ